jgi:hypothetical protein
MKPAASSTINAQPSTGPESNGQWIERCEEWLADNEFLE